MPVQEIRQHLFRLLLGRYQAYLWVDQDGTTLVDTGERGSGRLIGEALEEIGLRPQDVDRIVLTHFHADHAGSAAELVVSTQAEVVAHAADTPVIQGESPGPSPNLTDFERELHAQVAADLPPAPPVHVDHRVHDGDLLDFAGGVRVISTPGHTEGSIALHLLEHGICLTGDIAAEHQGQVMLGVFNLDREVATQSLLRVADLDIDVACFGHGDPVHVDAARRLRQAAEMPTP
jgi:glyoxylase-like metal-dependent hydrolase (beta-lactamase superfamily II)